MGLEERTGPVANEERPRSDGGREKGHALAERGIKSLTLRAKVGAFGTPGCGAGASLGHCVIWPYLQRLHDGAADPASLWAPRPPSLRSPGETRAGGRGVFQGLREEGTRVLDFLVPKAVKQPQIPYSLLYPILSFNHTNSVRFGRVLI